MRGAGERGIRLGLDVAGPLSKLVDETDSKSVAVDPASRFESGEGHCLAAPFAAATGVLLDSQQKMEGKGKKR